MDVQTIDFNHRKPRLGVPFLQVNWGHVWRPECEHHGGQNKSTHKHPLHRHAVNPSLCFSRDIMWAKQGLTDWRCGSSKARMCVELRATVSRTRTKRCWYATNFQVRQNTPHESQSHCF
jgi:hypothetical protein